METEKKNVIYIIMGRALGFLLFHPLSPFIPTCHRHGKRLSLRVVISSTWLDVGFASKHNSCSCESRLIFLHDPRYLV